MTAAAAILADAAAATQGAFMTVSALSERAVHHSVAVAHSALSRSGAIPFAAVGVERRACLLRVVNRTGT